MLAQPLLAPANLNAGWLWPKGVYTLAIHDGPGPRTEDIAAFLSTGGKVADFYQVLCHYAGQPWADSRSAMCFQQHTVPLSLLNAMTALHQCIGNHGQDHLVTPSLNQADTIYQIGESTAFFLPTWQQQNCPALLTFPGFQTDSQHIAWLNQDPGTSGRQQGPVGADFDGSGTIQTASGPVAVNNDQDCFTQGFSQQQCLALMLGAMAQANHGGIVNIHDYNPYAFNPLNPADLKSAYAYDYLTGIIDGCQQANNGTPCVWLTPDAVPGIHRNAASGRFSLVSDPSDDFSDRIASPLVGDIDGDSRPDVLVPRSDGLYCALNAGNGTLSSLRRCLSFDSTMVAERYWLVDVDGDKSPYLVWLNTAGIVGVKADGKGGFGSVVRVLSAHFAESKLRPGSFYKDSIRFGVVRAGISVPDLVVMTPSGVMIAANNGSGFDLPHSVPHLSYLGEKRSQWNPQKAGRHMLLMPLTEGGPPDIVIPGNSGLLYAKAGVSAFQALTTEDGFNYWSSPEFYTSLHATTIGGRTAIAGWTPVGIAYANFAAADHPTIDQFQVLCSDCLASLPGWLAQWQQSNLPVSPFPSGFADLKGTGSRQAFAVWGKGVYASDVISLPGY